MTTDRKSPRLRVRASFAGTVDEWETDLLTWLERENRQLRVVIESQRERSREVGKLGGRPKRENRPSPEEILLQFWNRLLNYMNDKHKNKHKNAIKAARVWLVKELSEKYNVDEGQARGWVREAFKLVDRKK